MNPSVEPMTEPRATMTIAVSTFIPASIPVARIIIGEMNWGSMSRMIEIKNRAGAPWVYMMLFAESSTFDILTNP